MDQLWCVVESNRIQLQAPSTLSSVNLSLRVQPIGGSSNIDAKMPNVRDKLGSWGVTRREFVELRFQLAHQRGAALTVWAAEADPLTAICAFPIYSCSPLLYNVPRVARHVAIADEAGS